MSIIGITGGIACGKSTLTNYIKDKGFEVIDADEIVAKLFLDPDIQKKILDVVGTLDKKTIRKIIFKSFGKRNELEKIFHPEVNKIIKTKISTHKKTNPEKPLFVSIPLLFENNLEVLFDQTISVISDEETQLARLTKRDDIDDHLAKDMIRSQLSNQEKEKKANITIHNDGTLDEFHKTIERFLQKI